MAEFYDALPFYNERRDAEFYLNAARQQGEPVLELGCGAGRVLLPTARAGIRVTGFDLSKPMLEKLRAKLAAETAEIRARVELIHGDMTKLDLGRKFRLITMPFRPFQHLLTVEEQIACLEGVNRHFAPGGRLVFDFFQVDPRGMFDPAFQKEGAPKSFDMPDGRHVDRTERIAAFHRAMQINDIELIHHVTHPGGRKEKLVYAFPMRYFFRYEVEHLLARCGLRVVNEYGDYDASPLTDTSPDMIFVAEQITP
jgi:SAM-dependent methyltransferase